MLTHQHPTKYVLDLVSSEKVTVQLKIYFNYNLALREFNINPYRPNVSTRFHQGFINYNFFVHNISRMQNHFRCTSVHVRNSARKRADVHLTNNNKILLKLLAAKNNHSIYVICIVPFLSIILFPFT